MVKLVLLGVVGVAIAYVVYMAMQNQVPSQTSTPDNQVTLTLSEQNNSGETGSMTLVEEGGKVVVTLTMTGSPKTVPQPAHIHTGTCPKVGAVVYPLTNVVDGMSKTTLDVSLADLKAKLPLGVNVHKSAAESKVYTSCGDLAL